MAGYSSHQIRNIYFFGGFSYSSHQIRNIYFFGGFSPRKEKEFLESAHHLGQVLAKRKIHLVYSI